VPLADSYAKAPLRGLWDWFDVNSVAEDSDGNLLVSARHTSTVYKIDRDSGSIIWRLGWAHSSFAMGTSARFYYQHDARREPDGTISVFDNASTEFDRSRGTGTKVLRLRVDPATKTVALGAAYSHPTGVNTLATSQGSARVIDGGNVFVGWGNSPWFSEYTTDGHLVFAAHLPSQWFQSYRAFKAAWHGIPRGKPAVAASLGPRGTHVYASWNGATDIARWRVQGGSSARALHEVTTVPWANLETKVILPTAKPLVQVEALDATGRVLGTSDVITPR
jgi:hypothetical protein